MHKRSLNNFIDIGYFIVSGAFQMYVTYFVAFCKDPIYKSLSSWEGYEKANIAGDSVQVRNKTEWIPIVNGIVTIVIAAWKAVALYDSIEEAILESSLDTAQSIFLWTTEHVSNQTSIENVYRTELNPTTYAMGVFGIISVFCWNLQVDCCKDLTFWIAKVNEHYVREFGKQLKTNLKMKSNKEENSDENDVHCWETYRQVMEVNMSTNATFFVILIISHLDTFLTFSYLLTLVLKTDVSPAILIITGYDVLKGVLHYFPARRASLEVCVNLLYI